MATVIDPVCGMRIESDDAAAIAKHEGQRNQLRSEGCRTSPSRICRPTEHRAIPTPIT